VLPALTRRTGSRDDAQDFLQEAAARVLTAGPHIESFEQLVRVVNVTAHRLVSNELRKGARLELRAWCEPTGTVPDVADDFEQRSARATLVRRLSVALGGLKDRDREAILAALNRPSDDSESAAHESDAERHRAANRLYYARRRLRARMDGLLAGIGCWRLRHAWQRLCGSPMASAAASGCLALGALAAPPHLPASTATVVVREQGGQAPTRAGVSPESLAVAAKPSQAAGRRRVDAPRRGGGPAPEAGSAPKPSADAAMTTVQWHAPSGQGARAAVQDPPPGESAMLCYGNLPAVAASCVAHPAKSPPTPPHTAPLP
jgi:DNA-directed RNA polymerase specialized sigma24 family protein